MRTVQVLLLFGATFSVFSYPGGVLENVRKVQVDPTVIERPEKVKDPIAAELVRYDLRAAVWDALMEEGDSSVRAHIVLQEFSRQSSAKRLSDMGTGQSVHTVVGRLVVQDASGKELASVSIKMRGSVAFGARLTATTARAVGRLRTSSIVCSRKSRG